MAFSNTRHTYSIGFKLQVVQYAKQHGNRAAERHFGPPPTEKMIRYWRKQEEMLKPASRMKCNLHVSPPKWVNLEKEMKNWIVEERSLGRMLSTKAIINEAKRRAAEQGMDDFQGTSSWCYRFLNRQGLAVRTKRRAVQKMPNDYEKKMIDFREFIVNARKETAYELGQIGNMDEVPITFDVLSNQTGIKCSNMATVKMSGHEKSHYTAVLSCCADGTKLPPLLIFRRKLLPKDKIPRGIFIHIHPKGWIDEEGVKIWFDKVWARCPGVVLNKPSLLMWDEFHAHKTEATKERAQILKTKLAIIPNCLTCQLQPLDMSINRIFKAFLEEEWHQWLQTTEHDVTPRGCLKKPTVAQVCEWVVKSWNAIKTEMVINSFKKCGLSNALDGTQDVVLLEDSDTSDSANASDAVSDVDGDGEFSDDGMNGNID